MSTGIVRGTMERPDAAQRREAWRFSDQGYNALAYLLAGPLFYGGIGYLLSRWLHTPYPILAGLLVGMGLAVYTVWLRYGRQAGSPGAPAAAPTGGTTTRSASALPATGRTDATVPTSPEEQR